MAVRNVSGRWAINQGNGFFVRMNIAQNGGDITGAADFGPDEDGNITNSMEAHGTVSEHDFLLTISWPNGTRGRYSGTFQADDFLAGTTVDLQHPQSQASWISDRTFPRPPGLT